MSALVLNGDATRVRKERRRLILARDDQPGSGLQVRMNDIDRVTVVGRPTVTMPVFQSFMREGVPVSFVSERGRWYGTLHPDGDRNASRRVLQYQQQGDPAAILLCARKIVFAKIRNQLRLLQHLASNRRGTVSTGQVKGRKAMRQHIRQVVAADNLASLRGIEGASAALYFKCLAEFFPPTVPFSGRSRRPPRDAANALLSWVYAIVLAEVDIDLRQQGLDPCFGWLHEIKDGRSSLALDLLEPLRAAVCDRFALKLLNQGILRTEHFSRDEHGEGVCLAEEGRKKFFEHYEPYMERPFLPRNGGPRYSLRQSLVHQVWSVLRLLDDPETEDADFFLMP